MKSLNLFHEIATDAGAVATAALDFKRESVKPYKYGQHKQKARSAGYWKVFFHPNQGKLASGPRHGYYRAGLAEKMEEAYEKNAGYGRNAN